MYVEILSKIPAAPDLSWFHIMILFATYHAHMQLFADRSKMVNLRFLEMYYESKIATVRVYRCII